MQQTERRQTSGRWVSLGGACRMLGVNESTLRNWADQGVIRAFRTPGGHRRFLREDLVAAMQGGGLAPWGRVMRSQTITTVTTRRIRRLIHGDRL
ncbi:MAG: helix-turn-helix domain-containing protein, partial [Chloroflexota bacterium]|nr:helix-turn-helix domain-containing protein [Chloroflexota bacterium]